MPWHACALGKCLVAHVSDRRAAGLLDAEHAVLTGSTITEPGRLLDELEAVLRLGYAIEDGEAAIGDAGIAAPVFDRDGVIGAIGLVGPVERLLAPAVREEFAVAVRETARLLSRDLGAGRPVPRRIGAA